MKKKRWGVLESGMLIGVGILFLQMPCHLWRTNSTWKTCMSCIPMSMPTIILINTHTTHGTEMCWNVQHIQIISLFWSPYLCKPGFTICTIHLKMVLWNYRMTYLMFPQTNFEFFHGILHIDGWIFQLECQTY
jgi:hypothetical protein